MRKEIKRLTLLSKCAHLSKTDRDALIWAIQQIEPPTVEPDKGFDGFDFSSWPEMPKQALFAEYVKARRLKHKLNMTQAWVDTVSPHMVALTKDKVCVNQALEIATASGWRVIKSHWVLNQLQAGSGLEETEEITINNVMSKILSGAITAIAQVPSPIRKELESNVRFEKIKKPASLKALQNIGFIL